MRFFFFLSFLLFSLSAPAEIRVFLLRIAQKSDPQAFRLVKSSLDPLQYYRYHSIREDEIVTYDDTWLCPGRTGDFREYCPSPRAPASGENPPSERPETKP